MEVTVIIEYMNRGWQDLHRLVLGDGDLHNPVCPRQRCHGRLEPIYTYIHTYIHTCMHAYLVKPI